MKTTLTILIVLLSIVGCKNEENKKSDNTVLKDSIATKEKNDCIDFTDYDLIDPTQTAVKVEWLKENGAQICPDLLGKKVEVDHVVTDDTLFGTMYESNKPTTSYSWNEIKSIIGSDTFYSNWINCTINSNEEVTLSMGDFTTSNSCYSIPLFDRIASKLTSAEYDDKIFEFKINTTTNKVVFTVKENYNFSQQPTSAIGKNLSIL